MRTTPSRRRRRRERRRGGLWRWLRRLLLLALLWLAGVAAHIVYVGERDQAGDPAVRADAIVVLGAAAYDSRPSPVFEERIRHGIDLFERGHAPVLLFTGGYGGSGARFAESEVGRDYAVRAGVPAEAILIETLSRNTHDNLFQARALLRARDRSRMIVVSDPLHMARALRLCRRLALQCLASATPTSRFRSLGTRWKFLINEMYFFHRDLFETAAEPDADLDRAASPLPMPAATPPASGGTQ